MARLPRFILPGQPQHIIQRGNNRQDTFREKCDYQYYIEKLTIAADKNQCDIHAYVLMTNHVHLLITPHTEIGIGKMMQMLGRYYVQFFNKKYNRTGTLWEGRYKAAMIDTEQYFLTCMRYIELNPVRAGMVINPREYIWSSYKFNALGEADDLVTSRYEYQILGDTEAKRQLSYRQLFELQLEEGVLSSIRNNTNKGWVLGSKKFKKKVSKIINRPVESQGLGGDRKSDLYQSVNKNS